ncbi:MAG: hypothetical protein QF921_01870 [Pseudomonadales bacterium]|jgi:hypothetical protein|nr:hypothetical protein [Pseudomonadales bacterium]MDP6472383.1 hypothetical protein [Pseudomonadales bacterium]MDP6828179.1 hypothetical protein [Pseudomonadales bacterium]MDP6970257.1 hypothetical protein [Pseudomonadales bacterium]|tara:strand:+ start:478 stop:912 length:435 start_codon:yes stop_codon:yes gene_type:complete
MNDAIATDLPFSVSQRQLFRSLAGAMIPAAPSSGLPGADDDVIFFDILCASVPLAEHVRVALSALQNALEEGGDINAVAQTLEPEHVGLFVSLVVRCFYRDERVMRSLEMEVRPPYPGGFEVEQGDWSLLDPVRERLPFYRGVK